MTCSNSKAKRKRPVSLDLTALAAANILTPPPSGILATRKKCVGRLIQEGSKVERCIRDDLTLKDAADNLKGLMEKELGKTYGKPVPNLTARFKADPLTKLRDLGDSQLTIFIFSNPDLSAVLLAGEGDAQLEHAVQALSDANENITSVIRTLDPISESSKELIVESVQKIIETTESFMRENADLKQQVSQLQRTNNSLVDKARSQEKFNHSLVYEAEAVTEDMKALQEDNKRLRQQFSSLQREFELQNVELAYAAEQARKHFSIVSALHLRVLQDEGRVQVVSKLKDPAILTWNALRSKYANTELKELIWKADIGLDPNTISFLCDSNYVRHRGNNAAHNAQKEDIRNAVRTLPVKSTKRLCSSALFQFIYGEDISSRGLHSEPVPE